MSLVKLALELKHNFIKKAWSPEWLTDFYSKLLSTGKITEEQLRNRIANKVEKSIKSHYVRENMPSYNKWFKRNPTSPNYKDSSFFPPLSSGDMDLRVSKNFRDNAIGTNSGLKYPGTPSWVGDLTHSRAFKNINKSSPYSINISLNMLKRDFAIKKVLGKLDKPNLDNIINYYREDKVPIEHKLIIDRLKALKNKI